MQTFVIFCKFFLLYKAGVGAETNTRDGTFAVLRVEFVTIGAFLDWFDPAEAC